MMDPNQPPMQQGGGDQIMDQLGMAVQELVQQIGPEQMMAILQEVAMEIQGGGEQMPPDQGMPPEVMSQGGPQAMPPQMPQAPPQRGMMGRRIPN